MMEKVIEMIPVQETKEKKKNRGFSLVELIIVIAIMAILVGVVGTQVVPYIEKSRQAKDYQIISGFCTAATTAYSSNAANIATTTGTITVNFNATTDTTKPTGDALIVYNEVKALTGYSSISTLAAGMESKAGKDISAIGIVIDLDNKTITVSTTQTTPATYVSVFKNIVGKF